MHQYDLPAMPELPDDVLAAHDQVHHELDRRVATSSEVASRLFRFVQGRILLEASASLDTVHGDGSERLFPPRRRYLSDEQAARVVGCRHAIRYLDGRLAMFRMGALRNVIDFESPMVLHAFVEANEPAARASNAGSIRVLDGGFVDGERPFVPAPPSHCRRLLDELVEAALSSDQPALTRASWLMTTLFAIHPFVDGNGRTGRFLCQGVLSQSLADGWDWGTIPAIAARRADYIAAARDHTTPSLPAYDARLLEPIHLMRHVAKCSIGGTAQAIARLEVLERIADEFSDTGWPSDAVVVYLAVAVDRNAHITDLESLLRSAVDATNVVNDLVDHGLLQWSDDGVLNLVDENPFHRSGE